ncbi:hypothetical protein AB0F81_38845 [Actinoplanes sp. NPDC024001]|uniref:hypothetical protein n=1 Tax=Actinoplanes sp. NPDC024001 TaxID=3154598 RepID=UPI0033E864EE
MVVVIGVVCLATASAVRPKVDLPWDRDGPAVATRQRAGQLVRAQQQAQHKNDERKALTARIVKETVDQEADRVALARAPADQAKKIKKRVDDREALITVLRARRDAAVLDQVAADSAVRVAAEKARKSERAAADRLGWLARASLGVLTLLLWAALITLWGGLRLIRLRQERLVHARFAVPGSLLLLFVLLAGVSLGWVAAAVILLGLFAVWIFRAGGRHA